MAAKKKAASRMAAGGAGTTLFTQTAIVISLSPADQRKAMACLKKNGRITFSMKEKSVTRLPQVLENGKLID
jgi:hypothetical protein